jgi:hypothetical protein
MNDLNMMMREQARNGLQTQLDAAVTNGDTEAARKIGKQLEDLGAANAPAKPPYGNAEIVAQLEKAPWYGIDPKKSAKAVEFGKTMDLKKFPTAEAYATALIKAVEDEFKPPVTEKTETDEEREAREAEEAEAAAAGTKPRKTDAPGEAEAGARSAKRATGPWTKLADAPADIQKEIKRQADKFVSSSAPKEQRETFITNALASHYTAHQRKTGKK